MLRYTNTTNKMKKFFVSLFVIMCCVFSASAQQTKTTYCDVYVRGGAKNQKVTIMYAKEGYTRSHSSQGVKARFESDFFKPPNFFLF